MLKTVGLMVLPQTCKIMSWLILTLCQYSPRISGMNRREGWMNWQFDIECNMDWGRGDDVAKWPRKEFLERREGWVGRLMSLPPTDVQHRFPLVKLGPAGQKKEMIMMLSFLLILLFFIHIFDPSLASNSGLWLLISATWPQIKFRDTRLSQPCLHKWKSWDGFGQLRWRPCPV